MVASAHGDLRLVLKNSQLSGLVGGTDRVLLGDDAARDEAKRKGRPKNGGLPFDKMKVQRGGAPIFEMVVELTKGRHDEYDIVMDTAHAVDCILDGKQYPCERRTRNSNNGTLEWRF